MVYNQDKEKIRQQLFDSALNYISYRPRSILEITLFLKKKLVKKKSLDTEMINLILTKLQKLGYADDHKFALWWVEERQRFKKASNRLISYELSQKGISAEILQEVLDTDEDIELAKSAISKKLKLWSKLPLPEQKQKIIMYLKRLGYSYDLIYRVIDWIPSNGYNIHEDI